ncbi:52 kDa repressor of the inhibitor of the protein kinase-like [Saccostrea cucullata]|uniref:52 kDa repressor of the inhibitor of the protein kinase-like n=1 Tax=Saccostrea cuccullata TaxID=36930 RepID=UPI002ECFEB1E
MEKNRHVLKEIIKVLLLCARQNVAIRGHTEERSNFIVILKLKSENDPILREHLSAGKDRATYLSPQIQNELIDLCARQIRDTLVTACNSAGCFGFIADEAKDCSTSEQISLCVRFYDRSTGEVKEYFLGFVEADSTTGEALAETFLNTLEEYGINVNNIRGQGYDGAANMAGKHRGVQARIRQRIPYANYTHCRAHSLNLAIVHACKEPLIRNLMDTVQTIAFAFDYSAKRLLQFKESLELDRDVKDAMDRKTKIKTLCETRWFSRVDSLTTFLKCYDVIVAALEELSEDGDSKARSHVCSILQFDFIVALVTAEHVLAPTNPLSALLQAKEQDLLEAVKECQAVISILQAERADDTVWEAIFSKCEEVGTTHNIAASVPRVVGRQQHRYDIPASDNQEFKREIQRWKARWADVVDKPATLADSLRAIRTPELYPNVYHILEILLSMPVSSASAERSFSIMRRLKTYLRSTMTGDRLSSLAVLHSYRETDIDLDKIIEKFAAKKPRRLVLQ